MPQVEFREPLYASARIPRNTTRRERGAGSDREVLVARALDRALRPLFPPGYRCKTQVGGVPHLHPVMMDIADIGLRVLLDQCWSFS
jgi:polyribonucleotide nucleotidyltransferase